MGETKGPIILVFDTMFNMYGVYYVNEMLVILYGGINVIFDKLWVVWQE